MFQNFEILNLNDGILRGVTVIVLDCADSNRTRDILFKGFVIFDAFSFIEKSLLP